jgi:hypothetical protein
MTVFRRAIGVRPTIQAPRALPKFNVGGTVVPEALMALGMGIANNDLGQGAQMLPGLIEGYRTTTQTTARNKNAAATLRANGELELADAVENGYMDAGTAFTQYLKKKSDPKDATMERKYTEDSRGVKRYIDDGSPVFEDDSGNPTTTKRETAKDAMGRERYLDTGELVFPEDETYKPPQVLKQEEESKANAEKAADRARKAKESAFHVKTAIKQAYKNLGYNPDDPDAPNPYDNRFIPNFIEGDGVSGFQGQLLQNIGGTRANNLRTDLNTIKANIGFDKLQEMRETSPTGGALGPVSDFENNLLQSTIASLEQTQSREQLIGNIRTVEKVYDALVNGVDDGTGTGNRRKITQEEAAALEAELATNGGGTDTDAAKAARAKKYGLEQ